MGRHQQRNPCCMQLWVSLHLTPAHSIWWRVMRLPVNLPLIQQQQQPRHDEHSQSLICPNGCHSYLIWRRRGRAVKLRGTARRRFSDQLDLLWSIQQERKNYREIPAQPISSIVIIVHSSCAGYRLTQRESLVSLLIFPTVFHSFFTWPWQPSRPKSRRLVD